MSSTQGDDLLRATVKTVSILVGACVVFVGTLSLVAVLVTDRVVGATHSPRSDVDAPAMKSAGPAAKGTSPAPKPLSI